MVPQACQGGLRNSSYSPIFWALRAEALADPQKPRRGFPVLSEGFSPQFTERATGQLQPAAQSARPWRHRFTGFMSEFSSALAAIG